MVNPHDPRRLAAESLKAAEDIAAQSRKTFREAAERHKLSIEKIAQRLSEALDAEERKLFLDKSGDIIESDPFPAHRVRLDAIKIAGEWLEIKPGDKIEHTGKNGRPITVRIVNYAEDEEE